MVDTLVAMLTQIKCFLKYFNNTDYIWKVSRLEFHFWSIFKKFQQQEVQLHLQSMDFFGQTSY